MFVPGRLLVPFPIQGDYKTKILRNPNHSFHIFFGVDFFYSFVLINMNQIYIMYIVVKCESLDNFFCIMLELDFET